MAIQLSQRVQRIQPSPTLGLTALLTKLREEGKDIIGLGAGEPDFDTPDHIKQAAENAMNQGLTKYTPVGGTSGLKQAIKNKFENDNGIAYDHKQILVSVGGKQSFFNLTQAVLNSGDEVIIPAPYWVSYPDMVLLADGKPVIVSCPAEQQFKMTAEQLEAAITAKTRLVVLNSPSNPTGNAYTMAELKSLAEVLLKHPDILIATDDMYEHILWSDEGFNNILMACPNLYNQTMVLNGVSKAYSMTGWRIGYAGGPEDIIKAMTKIQSQSTSNPCSISQAAAEAAISGQQGCVKEMVSAFKKRHDFLVDGLNSIDGINCLKSDGTFYAFPNMQGVIDKLDTVSNDIELASYFIDNAGVAMVPGSAFGLEGHLRLSFATSDQNLSQAIDRIKNTLA